MARRVKDASLDSRQARAKLTPRGGPYWRSIERGLHLGYRKLKGKTGTWWARHYLGNQLYEVEAIGAADDSSDADGVAVLNFWQAQAKARERMVKRAHAAVGKTGPLTVSDAMDAYLEFLEQNRKSAHDARSRNKLFISPQLGNIEIDHLTADKLRKWQADIARAPRFTRAGRGGEATLHAIKTDDGKRARRASANRTLTTLKAALNRLWRDGKVQSDKAWRAVQPFEAVDKARVRYLSVEEARRLINAVDAEFRPVVQAALQTGCRYGELISLQCHDFNRDAGTVAIRQSKSGKPRHVVLTTEGATLFKHLAAGQPGDAPLLRRADGRPWGGSDQARPMIEACINGKIKPRISFHGLRHTWASLAVMNGVPLLVVAKNLGHSDTRMVEKHYGHLAPSYIADAIRAGAPRFGLALSNVRPMQRPR